MISSTEASNVIQEGKVVPGIFMGWYFGPQEHIFGSQLLQICRVKIGLFAQPPIALLTLNLI